MASNIDRVLAKLSKPVIEEKKPIPQKEIEEEAELQEDDLDDEEEFEEEEPEQIRKPEKVREIKPSKVEPIDQIEEEVKTETKPVEYTYEQQIALLHNDAVFRYELLLTLKELISILKGNEK